ncbi:MAG: ABC transporter ATP-binding protein, partial [Clostridia bacterium]|nr:ABC transporter ATP-binding protein [Clostridia bacterium]
LDEPTSFLDIRYKLELLTILKELVKEKNISVLMSLHEIDLAERVSDRILCVAGNRIDKSGTPDEIFDKEYIAKLYNLDKTLIDDCFQDLEYV